MEAVKSYELRSLTSKDIFPTLKILSKIGIKEFKGCFDNEEVKAMVANAKDNEGIDVSNIGVAVVLDIADIILSHLPSCEEDIYQLLSGLSGMTKKEISELPLVTFTEMIIDVIKMDDFKDFIQAVSKLLK